MSHRFQFISPTGEPLQLNELDNDIRRDVLALPSNDEHFWARSYWFIFSRPRADCSPPRSQTLKTFQTT